MPNYLRPKRLFRGGEFGRLMVMIRMLVALYIMIRTARDPHTWKWLVGQQGKIDRVVKVEEGNDRAVERTPAKALPVVPRSSRVCPGRGETAGDRGECSDAGPAKAEPHAVGCSTRGG